MHKLRGFTLIELLIVIAVIAILVGITVPRFLGMRDEANTAKSAGETAALKAAVEAYRIHKKIFPSDASPTAWQSQLVAMRPQLIESALYDPFGATATTEYTLDVNGDYYVIFSIGADRAADIATVDSATGNLVAATGCTPACNVEEDIFATNGSGHF